jgi:hypothetical protein
MNDDLRRYLDGEAPFESLPESARAEAEAWERVLAACSMGQSEIEAPTGLEGRVMAEIATLPERSVPARLVEWLLRPRAVHVSPLTAGLAAATIAALILVPAMVREDAMPLPTQPDVGAVVYVEFRLEAPGARSVAVGGDFDEWDGSHSLVDPDEDGVWTGRIAIEPGLHRYMFLIDGSNWVTDPTAERYADDGFGNRNAVLAVTTPTA